MFFIRKFSSEVKINAVKQFLHEKDSSEFIAQSIWIDHSNFHQSVKWYKAYGEEAFIINYTSYPAPFKLDVLTYMKENLASIRETAAIFHIPSS
ncbi:transposase [Cytobacillus sp. IB215665]|uniref:transposase n=1 Tax=Cytobacillus sp. IB215665 TaxID=3097357 RepID=UPI002A0ED2D7|nr:transposase [Cytobacillus sp. IB215665]MDX8367759.1 transposase [Cytobacillus sp. IB215665]